MNLPKSILIIDDEPNLPGVFARFLCDYFPEAKILSQRVFTADLPPVDVILLDLFLDCPASDTLASLSSRHEQLPPIVCMTGKADAAESMENCMTAGAQDFISKERAIQDAQTLAEKITLAYLRHAAKTAG